ncbi:MAG: helix-turn-helix domain-containing protein [Propionibacteriaceae bacterium]|jgi:transcriptional regulator with XRE-family HTH domain|nr:helix-turn-helix domain-containing protein [Propionibacteriaceae bacterium]
MKPATERRISADLRTIGEDIRTFRKLNRLTMQQVAERAGVSRSLVSRLESGAAGVSIGSLLRVCRALGVNEILVGALDPYNTAIGKAQALSQLPQRIRN